MAADHAALNNQPLPPNYFFAPNAPVCDRLNELDIMIAGPSHTPFSAGAWSLHLDIPRQYPVQPPAAYFRTRIFHPNVNPQTGEVCVETLKRDWDSKLTLRDVLVTISCLLIQPNPDSALNEEAGALIQHHYDAFARQAKLMTSIHAPVPVAMRAAAAEAQSRGEHPSPGDEEAGDREEEDADAMDVTEEPPARRRRTIAAVRRAINHRNLGASPEPSQRARQQQQQAPSPPPPPHRPLQSTSSFVFQAGNDDVFGLNTPLHQHHASHVHDTPDDDDAMTDGDQENDQSLSPSKPLSTKVGTPRRPNGAVIPLGDLIMESSDDSSIFDDGDGDVEFEYPPSPRKSPLKRPANLAQVPSPHDDLNRRHRHHQTQPESSQNGAASHTTAEPNVTPPNCTEKPLASPALLLSSPPAFLSPSPRKARRGLFPSRHGAAAPAAHGGGNSQATDIFTRLAAASVHGVSRHPVLEPVRSPRRDEQAKRAERNARLWELCGRDIGRWNRGDFDGMPFPAKAARW